MASALRLLDQQVAVAIVKDDAISREGMTALLTQDDEFTVASSVPHLDASSLGEIEVDVLLVDAQMTHGGDRLVAATLASAAPHVRVIVTGVSAGQRGLPELVRAGVAGFVIKDASYPDLAEAIRIVAEGGRVMPPSLLDALLRDVSEGRDRRHKSSGVAAFDRMTAREQEITELIANGKSNKEIAQVTCASTHTIKTHVRNIMSKLGLHTRLQVAARVNEERWSRRGEGAVNQSTDSGVSFMGPLVHTPERHRAAAE